MRPWDDNEFPLAHFITFRTYGSWLHGDERRSIDRYHNEFGGPRMPVNPVMKKQHQAKLKSAPVVLDSKQRSIVEAAIREVCDYREWWLRAINVRTNHGHLVVSMGSAKPDRALRDFKAYSTRAMRNAGLWPFEHSPWVDGGSTRYLWSDPSVANACHYVLHAQESTFRSRFDLTTCLRRRFCLCYLRKS